MNHNKDAYPEGSVLSQIYLDIYANKATGEVTVLYDTVLTEVLLKLEYEKDTRELTFVFEPGNLPLGALIEEDLGRYLEKSDSVTFIHIDMETKKPISGMDVPLTLL